MINCSPRRRLAAAVTVTALCALSAFAPTAFASSPSGGGGNGGNSSSASSATNTFSPPVLVDYDSLGGEPTTVVDRYPITSGTSPTTGQSCSATAPCYPDIVYDSNPLGVAFPGYSQFYRSVDGGTSFRLPYHNPALGEEPFGTEGGGGGDSHLAVGQTTHSVFMVDLSGYCVTIDISRDYGETFSSNRLGCEANPGVIDDRPWVAADETGGLTNVYMNVNNDTGCLVTPAPGCSIVFVKSTDDGGANTPADFAASQCNAGTMLLTPGVTSSPASACPDPSDPNFVIAGPVTVDTSSSSPYWHSLYIPFERNVGGNDFQLWVAISRDQGQSWTQHEVADLGAHDPANIFPELTVDQGGNLYYTWSQAHTYDPNTPADEGETDVYYVYSTDGGASWSAPIDLTKQTGDSAVFPWMVAGSPGKVDLVYYKANSGLNPNIAYYNSQGQSCDPSTQPTGCYPNTTQWNTYFAQSQNALNPGANFRTVQISPHPIHQGGICTQGIACQSSGEQNRDLLDFFTVDVDHTGAAYVTWADDNNSTHYTRQFFSRQLAGSSIFDGQQIAAKGSWPTTDHSATTTPTNQVTDAAGIPESCPSMQVLADSAERSGGALTVTMTLGAPPSAAAAIGCSREGATGGLWGVEFWAASPPNSNNSGPYANDEFYLAYRDNPPDNLLYNGGMPGVEAGRLDSLSAAFTHVEFHHYENGAPVGGSCFATPAPSPCTIVMSASLAGLGIKAGSALDSVTGLSVYFAGSESQALGIATGNSNLADAIAPFDMNGTGTTAP
jgi:hypothetical protein